MALRIFTLLLSTVLFASLSYAEPFDVNHLVRLHRVGAPVVSPDGQHVVYTVRETDMETGKGRVDVWLSPVAGGEPRRLTVHEGADSDPAWSSAGDWVYFLSGRSGTSQVWRIAPKGGEAVQVTDLPLDIGTFRLSPADDRLVVSIRVYSDCDKLACTVERDKTQAERKDSAKVYDQLFMRHWDHWLDAKISRLFTLSAEQGLPIKAEPLLLTGSVDAEVPARTWGGREEYAVSKDGKTLFFTARLRNPGEAWSTNYDIWSVPLTGGDAVNLTESNPAWDTQPVVSPDGRLLAWMAMSRPGFEADRYRIMLRDLASGATRELAPEWDRSPSSIAFSQDGNFIYANAQDVGQKTLWRFELENGRAERVAGGGTISSFDAGSGTIVFARDSLASPSELYVMAEGGVRQLTNFTGPQLENVQLGSYEQFSFDGAHGDTVYGYVMKPAGFDEGKQYPVAFLIHGGPQGSFGDHWHYRWNPQTYAGQGFAAVFIDFHGSTGYGQAFTDAISGDWGGAPLEDLQKGLAAAAGKYSFLDTGRACALGASYGGFMINWIAGNWPDGFDCLVNHDGVFDQRMMYYATEELWFPEWDQGGTYHGNPEGFEQFNPVNNVEHWNTPMMVIHGELDYRVPVTQGIAAFTALQRLGVESRFVYFPDENHWVLNAHNSIRWHDTVNAWLHRYLDSGGEQ
jgi:dipeptidyl aminopeptidase/acylaminoacyl peptidase